MKQEYELKLGLLPEHVTTLRKNTLLRSLARGRMLTRRFATTYYDTRDGALKRHGAALRVRKSGRKLLQSLKISRENGLAHHDFGEVERAVKGKIPDVTMLTQEGVLDDEAVRALGESLAPVFTTDVSRTRMVVRMIDSDIELAVDVGEVKSADASAPICELELELLSGQPGRLYELALALLEQQVPLRLIHGSKAEKGFELLSGPSGKAVKSGKFSLEASMSAAEAFRNLGRVCYEHLRANEDVALEGKDPEGVHQMRVALRRMRSLIGFYQPLLTEEVYRTLKEEFRWLRKSLGPAREWDVFLLETLPPLEKRFSEERAFEDLRKESEAFRTEAYGDVARTIQEPRYTRLLLKLGLWLSEGDPFVTGSAGIPASLPARTFAEDMLQARTAKLVKAGKAHKTLSEDELHRIRIESKKLRYAFEFFGTLFKRKKVRKQLKALVGLQETLGSLNDAVVTKDLLANIEAQSGHAPERQADLQRAIGLVVGWQAANIDRERAGFRQAWQAYTGKPAFQG